MNGPWRWFEAGEMNEVGEIRTRGANWTPPDEEWIRDQYEVQEKSMKQIAEEVRATQSNVKRWLELHGVEARPRGTGVRRTRSDKGKTRGRYRRRPRSRAPESLRERAGRVPR